MKFDIICADPPYEFSDPLTMSDVKRGAASNYNGVLSLDDIKNLDIESIAAENSLLALWVPSSMLLDGLEIMNRWGRADNKFLYKQNFIWVKTKIDPFGKLIKSSQTKIHKLYKKLLNNSGGYITINLTEFYNYVKNDILPQFDYDFNNGLQCKMGRIFRQTHEICLIGVRGNMYDKVENKSQISVHMHPPLKPNSTKPEGLQDRLDLIFSEKKLKRLELFARRQRNNYICLGNEAPMNWGEDIRDSIDKLKRVKVEDYNEILELAKNGKKDEMANVWKNL